MKKDLKTKSIDLRKQGFSYSEILRHVRVSKSTLSLWLRSVNLTKEQKQRLTAKKILSIRRGWEACRQKRIKTTEKINKAARLEIKKIKRNKKDLLLMGSMLYWAEGSKYKKHNISQGVCFSNQDPDMIRLFLLWLKVCLQITPEQIVFEVYIHKNYENKVLDIRRYWRRVTKFSEDKFDKIYFKKHNTSTLRRNRDKDYFGLLRIRIRKSTNLNRKIAGYIEEICKKWGIV